MGSHQHAIRIGISGWTYPPWRGVFFPKGWPHKRELEYASRQVASIEINGTFYSLQRPASYRAWYQATPENFVFAVKGGRFITHIKRLNGVTRPLANFFASGILCLRKKLGPILWQLPPSFRFDRERLERFFELLPRDTSEAGKLAHKHDGKVKGRAVLTTDTKQPIRHALEVRHSSFESDEFLRLLRKHDIGLVIADTAGKSPFIEDVTSDFVYIRLHGDAELYVSGYTQSALKEWARKIRGWAKKADIYVYFDNDVKVRAPFDAMSLAHRLRLGPAPGPPPDATEVRETARRGWPMVGKSKRAKATRRAN